MGPLHCDAAGCRVVASICMPQAPKRALDRLAGMLACWPAGAGLLAARHGNARLYLCVACSLPLGKIGCFGAIIDGVQAGERASTNRILRRVGLSELWSHAAGHHVSAVFTPRACSPSPSPSPSQPWARPRRGAMAVGARACWRRRPHARLCSSADGVAIRPCGPRLRSSKVCRPVSPSHAQHPCT